MYGVWPHRIDTNYHASCTTRLAHSCSPTTYVYAYPFPPCISLSSTPLSLLSDTVMLNPNTQDSPSVKIMFKDYVQPPQKIRFPELAAVLEVASQEMAKVRHTQQTLSYIVCVLCVYIQYVYNS